MTVTLQNLPTNNCDIANSIDTWRHHTASDLEIQEPHKPTPVYIKPHLRFPNCFAKMAAHGKINISIPSSAKSAGDGDAVAAHSCSSKGPCLCSPTTHPGSFRCRLHRSNSLPWTRHSKSTASSADAHHTSDLSPKSVESAWFHFAFNFSGRKKNNNNNEILCKYLCLSHCHSTRIIIFQSRFLFLQKVIIGFWFVCLFWRWCFDFNFRNPVWFLDNSRFFSFLFFAWSSSLYSN